MSSLKAAEYISKSAGWDRQHKEDKKADQETLAKDLIGADPQEVREVREKELRCHHVKNVQPDKSTKSCGVEKRTE